MAQQDSSTTVPPGLSYAAGVTWRLLVVGAGIAAIAMLVGQVTPVVLALFFALIVTALAEPVVRFLQRRLPTALSVAIALVAMGAIVVAVFGFVVKSIVEQAPQLVEQLQKGFDEISTWLSEGPLKVDARTIAAIPEQIGTWLSGQAGTIAKFALGEVGSLLTLVTAVSVFAFACFFFLARPRELWSWFLGWIPQRRRDLVDNLGLVGWGTMSGYVRGIILVALADAALVLIGLLILGVPLAPVLAVVVFFGALIPIIGAPIATLLAAVVALATVGPVKALLVVALTIVVGSFDGDVLQPLIMGKAVSLHPLAIVTVLAIGTISGGLIGALVCVPLAATAYAMAKYLTGREPAPEGPPADAGPPGTPA